MNVDRFKLSPGSTERYPLVLHIYSPSAKYGLRFDLSKESIQDLKQQLAKAEENTERGKS